MNKIAVVGLLFVAFFLSSCGSNQTAPAANSPHSGNSASGKGVSFGVYDIGSSGPSFLPNPQTPPAANVAATDYATRGLGGGGGGGKELGSAQTSTAISLSQAQSSQADPAAPARRIVRNAELNIEAENPEDAQSRISAIAQSKSGFVVESQQSNSDVRANTRDVVQMTVRVPADRFTETLEEIKAASGRLIAETIKGEDVSEEFIDIDARLKAKKALEQQFTEIMKRANSVEDALSVQSELAEVRGEIEKIEGRRRFLDSQTSLSTIKIRLQTPAVFSAQSAGFVDRLSESFGSGFDIALNFILSFVTFLVGALPLIIFVGLPGYFISRAVIRSRNRPLSVTEIARDEIKND